MIHAHRIPLFVRLLWPALLWKKDAKEKKIYLTFDDGPIPEITPWILEQLKQYNARATFFCVGDNIRKYPQIFQSILDEGHQVGNHTYHHLNGYKTASDRYFDDVEDCQQAIESFRLHSTTKLLRPPYGKIRSDQIKYLKSRGYTIVMWSVLTGDYHQALTEEECLQKAIKHSEEGSIVVFHDNLKAKKNLSYALPGFLAYFSKIGYQFESLC